MTTLKLGDLCHPVTNSSLLAEARHFVDRSLGSISSFLCRLCRSTAASVRCPPLVQMDTNHFSSSCQRAFSRSHVNICRLWHVFLRGQSPKEHSKLPVLAAQLYLILTCSVLLSGILFHKYS